MCACCLCKGSLQCLNRHMMSVAFKQPQQASTDCKRYPQQGRRRGGWVCCGPGGESRLHALRNLMNPGLLANRNRVRPFPAQLRSRSSLAHFLLRPSPSLLSTVSQEAPVTVSEELPVLSRHPIPPTDAISINQSINRAFCASRPFEVFAPPPPKPTASD
ncbi:hypothetical protein P171DRAFT_65527 [Karstenula rhodostoma CBS 690.94]|uniref:Uncharacterized protein n=1 Tax=Karstenula rhodostoma CBS 690.94 TaxID=1392251 RepID=A0A9P4PC75_9PLEO|nr:hypothetical protein P171DRAFT_65527 [Karstenula rhodostoma CBS 690.94]